MQKMGEKLVLTYHQRYMSDSQEHVKMTSIINHLQACSVDSAIQAPLPMGFSRQEYGVGCHFLLQGTFPTQGLNLGSLPSPALADRFFTTSATWEAPLITSEIKIKTT